MNACATFSEIASQPQIWRDWAKTLGPEAKSIQKWISDITPRKIWLCGAGTSAFIGDILAPGLAMAKAIPTTDIVATPQHFLDENGPIIAVQFGRSGDSSESLGMLDLLDQHRPDIHRLHITCNSGGALANRPAPGPGTLRVLTLPDATHDTGFAMTSSFSTMALSALACLDPDFDAVAALPDLARRADVLFEQVNQSKLPRPKRAVFLGSGAFTGAARESALKVSELTAGQTATLWDSPLGFRHGPKAFVDTDTHIFMLSHPDPYTARYEADLCDELRRQFPETPLSIIGRDGTFDTGQPVHLAADAVLAVLPTQVLATRWSADLGLNVDNPFEGHGNLTRVVSGVTLHRWHP